MSRDIRTSKELVEAYKGGIPRITHIPSTKSGEPMVNITLGPDGAAQVEEFPRDLPLIPAEVREGEPHLIE